MSHLNNAHKDRDVANLHIFVAREPLCVNLLSKNLARDIQSIIQGSKLKVTNKGSCW